MPSPPSTAPSRHPASGLALPLEPPSAFPQKAPFSQLPHLRLKRKPTPGRKDNRKADRAGEMEDVVLREHGGPLTPRESTGLLSPSVGWSWQPVTLPKLGQWHIHSTSSPLSQAPFRRDQGCIYRNNSFWDSLLFHLHFFPSLFKLPQIPYQNEIVWQKG